MAIQTIVSGTGFSGLIPYNDSAVGTDRQGSAGATGYNKKAIARWTEPPCSLYRENKVVGLMAFHADGIKEVDFVLNGGATITVATPEFNPETGFNEYCVQLDRTDITGTMGEEFNNVELRAIVKPNVGIPRVLQHDIAGISGPEATRIINQFGLSGGFSDLTAGPSGDGTMIAGEHSFVATMFKDNTISEKPNIEVFMHPNGDDNNTGRDRSQPVRTLDRAVDIIRLAMKSDPFTHDSNDNQQYVDRGIVTFLAGDYNENHFYMDESFNPERRIDNLYTYLIVRGDPNESLGNIKLYLEDSTTQKGLNIASTGTNRALSLIKYENLWFDMERVKKWDHYKGYFTCAQGNKANENYTINTSKKATFDLTWLKSCAIVDNQYSRTNKEQMYLGATTTALGGPIMTECFFKGAQNQAKGARGIIRNLYQVFVGEDQSYDTALMINNRSVENRGNICDARRIEFTDPENPSLPHPVYGKFNGWYITHTKYDILDSADGSDNGSYLTNATTNPHGFTIRDLGPNFGSFQRLGTVFRKINEDAWLGNLPDTERLNLPGTIPNEIPDDFFVPYDSPMATEETLSYQYGSPPIDTVYQKGASVIFTNDWANTYFENKWMVALTVDSDELGFSGAGFALFDSDKPLVYGNDTDPNKQQFLWRYSGEGAETNSSVPRKFPCNLASFWSSAANTTNYYDYSWAEGVTSTALVQNAASSPEIQNANAGGHTNDAYPVGCRATNGTEDGNHSDFIQFVNTTNSSNSEMYPCIENKILAYNIGENFNGQLGNAGRNTNYVRVVRDFAMVNNMLHCLYGNSRYENPIGVSSFGLVLPEVRNLLVEHNSILNTSLFMKGSGATGIPGPFGDTLDMSMGDWTFRNNIIDYISGDAFDKDTAYAFKSYLDGYDNTLFNTSNTISEANYVYVFNDADTISNPLGPQPGPGLVGDFGQKELEGVTGFIFCDVDRKMNLSFNEYTSEITNQVVPLWTGQYKIIGNVGNNFRSPLIGGATNSSVYDDIYRVKRNNIATVGPVEFKWQNTGIPIGSSTTNTSFSADDLGINPEDLYGKKIKIIATKDGEELLSQNSVVINGFYMDPSNNIPLAPDQDRDEITHTFKTVSNSGVLTYYYPPNVENVYDSENGNIVREGVYDWIVLEYQPKLIKFFPITYTNSSGLLQNRLKFEFFDETRKDNFVNHIDGQKVVIEFMEFDGSGLLVAGSSAEIDTLTKTELSFGEINCMYHLKTSSGVSFDITEANIENYNQTGVVKINRPVTP